MTSDRKSLFLEVYFVTRATVNAANCKSSSLTSPLTKLPGISTVQQLLKVVAPAEQFPLPLAQISRNFFRAFRRTLVPSLGLSHIFNYRPLNFAPLSRSDLFYRYLILPHNYRATNCFCYRGDAKRN